jgi:hypothetical protein
MTAVPEWPDYDEPVIEPELPLVAAPSLMGDDVFVKHFNARHTNPGAVPMIQPIDIRKSWPDQTATYRAYHRKIHDGTLGYPITHIHSQGTQSWQDPEEKK